MPNRLDKSDSGRIAPHGGELKQLVADGPRAELLKVESEQYPSVTLSQRQLCDLELLMNGGFSPLEGFMGQADYDSVLDNMCLASGELWPIPVVLDVSKPVADELSAGDKLALRDAEGFMVAVLSVSDIWTPDKEREALQVYGANDSQHPGVRYLQDCGEVYLGGKIEGLQLPSHFDFEYLWHTPEELRNQFEKNGWRKVLAFQTSKPMHQVHRAVTLEAALEHGTHLLIHPTVGDPRPGDIPYHLRVHCYEAIKEHYPKNLTLLSLLPLAMRMSGPRDALLYAIVHQNYGCSHILMGPYEGSPPDHQNESGWYQPGAAQALVREYQSKLSIQPVAVEEYRYSEHKQRYLPGSSLPSAEQGGHLFSERDIKACLAKGEVVPDWVSFPNVLKQLERAYPPKSKIGFTLFFTGLSGAGKSTLAKIIYAKLIEEGSRPVTLLDGDVVRLNLSSELGFSRGHRDLNIRRIGFVANEVTKNGGIAICAPIAPYSETRKAVRALIEEHGDFIEIFASTPLETCESRDRKGLYAKARKGLIKEFTGISDPYEEPENPEIAIDTTHYSPMEAAQEVLIYLLKQGYLSNGV